ncbi:hypothetical protein HYALB_00002782 [Hymenoscyphus albidus]|uniref:Myb-like domain-containing protein n=1 Tax=Hymenoscyphus albidus TaxID=595503 RepID=A0A9N9PZR0_9HELO|nr:hypothetical protein HYALB_00002782 [Hymenoscyphus albidus]
MLLPSAFGCDPSQQSTPKTRFQARMLFASPPLSPPPSSSTTAPPALNNLLSTCRALHSMLQPSLIPSQLPSPPTQHASMPPSLSSPHKLRLRSRNTESSSQTLTPRKRVAKRTPRGLNKRRRESTQDSSRDSEDSEEEWTVQNKAFQESAVIPSTPKRQRIAPEVLPLGLERGDFHTLHLQQQPDFNFSLLQNIEQNQSQNQNEDQSENERGNSEWSTEEDSILVELVLEKLKLSKSDWQDCARSLGKDRGSVGKRWKSLMGNGDVGLKRGTRSRTKLHGSWR